MLTCNNMNEKKFKLECFARPPRFVARLIITAIGVICMALAISILVRLNLGTDPFAAFAYGVINHIPVGLGTAEVCIHLIGFIFVIIFDSRKIGFGTIMNMVCLGYLIEFFTWIEDMIFAEGIFEIPYVRFGLLIPALVIFVCGCSAYMTSDLGSSPYDAIPFIISAKFLPKVPFKIIRITFDLIFTVSAFLLGGEAGVITILMVIFLGPVIDIFKKWFDKILV